MDIRIRGWIEIVGVRTCAMNGSVTCRYCGLLEKNTVVRGDKEINCCFLVASNIVFGKTAITRAGKLNIATQRK